MYLFYFKSIKNIIYDLTNIQDRFMNNNEFHAFILKHPIYMDIGS